MNTSHTPSDSMPKKYFQIGFGLLSVFTLALLLAVGSGSFFSHNWLLGFYAGSCLAWYVYTDNPKAELNRNYGLTFFFGSLYLLLVWALHALPAETPVRRVLLWSRVLVLGTLFTPVAVFRFMRILSEYRGRLSRSFEAIGWLIGASLMLLNLLGLYLGPEDLIYRTDKHCWFPRMQGYYQLFTAYTLIWVPTGLVLMAIAFWRITDQRRRFLLLYFFVGWFAIAVSACMNFLGSVSLGFEVPWPGGLVLVAYVLPIGYIIVRDDRQN